MQLHPKIVKVNGQPSLVVLSLEEFKEVEARLEDANDLIELRRARKTNGKAEGMTIEEAQRRLAIKARRATPPRRAKSSRI